MSNKKELIGAVSGFTRDSGDGNNYSIFNDTQETAYIIYQTPEIVPWSEVRSFDVRPATISDQGADNVKVDTWYKFQVPWSGEFTCHGYALSYYDGYLELYRAGSGTRLRYNDDSGGQGQGMFDQGTIQYTPGEWLYIRERPYSTARGDFQLQIYGPLGTPPNPLALTESDVTLTLPDEIGVGYDLDIQYAINNRMTETVSMDITVEYDGNTINETIDVPSGLNNYNKLMTTSPYSIETKTVNITINNININNPVVKTDNVNAITSDRFESLPLASTFISQHTDSLIDYCYLAHDGVNNIAWAYDANTYKFYKFNIDGNKELIRDTNIEVSLINIASPYARGMAIYNTNKVYVLYDRYGVRISKYDVSTGTIVEDGAQITLSTSSYNTGIQINSKYNVAYIGGDNSIGVFNLNADNINTNLANSVNLTEMTNMHGFALDEIKQVMYVYDHSTNEIFAYKITGAANFSFISSFSLSDNGGAVKNVSYDSNNDTLYTAIRGVGYAIYGV